MNAFPWIFACGFIGAHIGWFWLQQNYVPEKERHTHPVIKLYESLMKPKTDDT